MELFVSLATLLLCSVLLLFQHPALAQKPITLTDDGSSDYRIVVDEGADSLANFAATELRKYIRDISGATLKIISGPVSGEQIRLTTKRGNGNPDFGNDGFSFKTQGSNIMFSAGSSRGLLNAVYTFLEKHLGCRCYTEDAVFIPRQPTITLGAIDDTDIPFFTYRLDYYGEAFKPLYARWHKLSNIPGDQNQQAKTDWGLWVHTMHTLVPPDKYFGQHPEYFSLKRGVRSADQVCFSSPEVLRIATASLREEIRKNPGAKYWSVSQMDNYGYCECPNCARTDSIEGSHCGSIIHFVNKVAAEFPDKVISTLAYQFSRKPPVRVRPAKNVNIMLCTIECDRMKPITSDQSEGGFLRDMQGWAKRTDNILVWDYLINYSNICSPFPNYQVIQPNIQMLRKYGVRMTFQQAWPGLSGEMEELRSYLIAKLLWDPDVDVDSLTADFLDGYFGAAGKFIGRYLGTMTRALNQTGKGLSIYEAPFMHSNDYLSPAAMKFYNLLFDSAMHNVIGDSLRTLRVDLARQPLRYAMLEVSKQLTHTKDWLFEDSGPGVYTVKKSYEDLLETFYTLALRHGPRLLHETKLTPDDYYDETKGYFERGVARHLAVGKKYTLASPYAEKYGASGEGSLTDGVRGTMNWYSLWQGFEGTDFEATIDLGEAKDVQEFSVEFMDDNQSWIFAPQWVRFETSLDGNKYTLVAKGDNPHPGEKIDKQTVPFVYRLPWPRSARYVRFTAKNIGELPAWKGFTGKAWLFTDEMIVR